MLSSSLYNEVAFLTAYFRPSFVVRVRSFFHSGRYAVAIDYSAFRHLHDPVADLPEDQAALART